MLEFVIIVDRLRGKNLLAISEVLGLHYHTVRNIANGKQKNPRLDTIRKLSDYLEEKE